MNLIYALVWPSCVYDHLRVKDIKGTLPNFLSLSLNLLFPKAHTQSLNQESVAIHAWNPSSL